MSNLFGTPRQRPASMLARAVTSGFPLHDRTRNGPAARRDDSPGEPVGDVCTQRVVHQQARRLRPPRRSIRVPLRGGRAIREPATASGGIAPQLSGNCRWGTRQVPRDLPNPVSLCPQHG